MFEIVAIVAIVAVVLAIAAMLILAATKPASFGVQRTVSVTAPPGSISADQ